MTLPQPLDLSRSQVLDTARASAWYRIQSVVASQTALAVGALWDRVERDRIAESWRILLPQAVALIAAQSTTASSGAGMYVAQTISDAHADPAGVAVNTSRLIDRAVIEYQMLMPLFRTLHRIDQGMPAADALASGRILAGLIGSQTTRDIARESVEIAMVAEPKVTGYVRYLVAPSCGRCAVLAGRVYPWSAGFLRHPRCDCQHRPIVNSERPAARSSVEGSASSYFKSLSEADQNKHFGVDVAERIRSGESMSRAVNADRTMWRANYPASRTVGDLPRPIVNAVMAQANGDRAKAVEALRGYGLINESGHRTFFAIRNSGKKLPTAAPRA